MTLLRFMRFALLAAFIYQVPSTASAEDAAMKSPLGNAQSTTTSVTTEIFNQLVIFDIPSGWKTAQKSANQTQHIIEFIPQDQTITAWKDMITMQAFRGTALNPKATPVALLSVLAAGIQKACGDKFVAQSLGDMKVDSFDAHAAIIGCAKLPTDAAGAKEGQSEIGIYVSIKGSNDFYFFQRAIRGAAFDMNNPPISAANNDDAFLPMHSVKLCGGSIPIDQCSVWKAH